MNNIRKNHNVPYGTYSNWYKKTGIYWIKNKETNRIYIGSSKNITSRLIKHFSQLRCKNHPNKNLQNDYQKYGLSSFDFGVYEFTTNLFEKEKEYQLKVPTTMLYNLQIAGNLHSNAQLQSWKHSDKTSHQTSEYRQKMKKLKANKIGRFDEQNVLLEIFENSDIVCKQYPIAKSTLLGCCNGSKKRALGFKWHYLDSENNIMLEGKGKNRTIIK